MREGLEVNNVLDLTRKFPDIGRKVFLYDKEFDQLTSETFLENVNFEKVQPQEAVLFSEALKELTNDQLQSLFQFATGGVDVSTLGCNSITLEINTQQDVFASSCAFSLSIPQGSLTSKEDLVQTLVAMTLDVDSFNTF